MTATATATVSTTTPPSTQPLPPLTITIAGRSIPFRAPATLDFESARDELARNKPPLLRAAAEAAIGLPTETAERLLKFACAEHARRPELSEAFAWATQTVDGVVWLVHRLAKTSEQSPAIESVREAIGCLSLAQFNELTAAIQDHAIAALNEPRPEGR